ncbi:pyridoxal phosphate-dependent aminotransferase [Halocatena salina]|uniref:Aminotransferase n=1 Tax=Halocatena salina TaxID=2934340 RepID=A0A8U0A3X7_9EURY|nr:pyridoxal phosphate-dependent aminotransferase [Halocatena salina]UPM43911.1 pyridoxal phosphate-dependent aminotransferase [Halocatena salina]
MNTDFTERIQRVEPSATIAISNLASELEADGVDVVDLSVGEPDFPTPEPIVDAAKDAMDAGHTGYAPSNGIPALRSAIADSLGERGLSYDPAEIMVTPGGKQALFEVVQTLVEDGSEVVLLDPAWVSYEAMVKIAGGSLERVDLTPHDFQLEPALPELAETVSAETDLMIVNSPSNPSGAVFSEAALDGVRDLAVEHDVTVIADEMYDRITYGVEQTSLGTLDGMAERTVTVNGFSKAYSMTGWRLGYFAAPSDLVDQADKLQSHSVTCATNFVQHAGVAALTECEEYVTEMRDAFAERRDMLVDLFDDHGVDVPVGDGAFYMMVPVADDDQQWCENALSEAHVATVPGSAFGTPGYARLSYAASTERLQEGVERLANNGYL